MCDVEFAIPVKLPFPINTQEPIRDSIPSLPYPVEYPYLVMVHFFLSKAITSKHLHHHSQRLINFATILCCVSLP